MNHCLSDFPSVFTQPLYPGMEERKNLAWFREVQGAPRQAGPITLEGLSSE